MGSTILAIILILIVVILALIGMVYLQITMSGMKVKDFLTFIKANATLTKLYKFSNLYQKLPPNEQLVFLKEAEFVFSAFDKVPNELWEEEYDSYMKILSEYNSIRLNNWKNR